ncbi:MAG: hypothetical protein U0797_21340 [Gemmataceae bacterium]
MDELTGRLARAIGHHHERATRIGAAAAMLDGLDTPEVLGRGV